MIEAATLHSGINTKELNGNLLVFVCRNEFVKLLKLLLSIDPEKRVIPDAALSHPFITLTHLAEYNNSEVLVVFLYFPFFCSHM